MQSEAVEKYLKTIYEIQQSGGRVKTSALATKLGVTAGSVTDMVKRLASLQSKLVTHELHKGVSLTPRGKKIALNIIRRHRLLETFLNQVLGYSWDEVHEEAENLENHVSERLTDAIAKYLNHPQYDPHGDPIPEKNGKMIPAKHRSLSTTPVGETVRVARVRHYDSRFLQYLEKLGVQLDTMVTILDKAPFNGPISIRVGMQKNAPIQNLGANVAEDIFVEPISNSISV
ncbi:MAG: metal-dependent transcriptional regulator [Desulfobacterales bacterium]|nr:metal-dependent transcriptional regulator [Deltaproteobacteria bacterium]NNL74703.1 metal-dependent transcriptional regulator [Desulfobacterales bacterium]